MRTVKSLALFSALVFFASCIEREETLTLKKDKSGTVEVWQRSTAPVDPMEMLRQMMGGGGPAEAPAPKEAKLWDQDELAKIQEALPEGVKVLEGGKKEKGGNLYDYYKLSFASIDALKKVEATALRTDVPKPDAGFPGMPGGLDPQQLAQASAFAGIEVKDTENGFVFTRNAFEKPAGADALGGAGPGMDQLNNPQAAQMMQGFNMTFKLVLEEEASDSNAQRKEGKTLTWSYGFEDLQKSIKDEKIGVMTATVGEAPKTEEAPVTTTTPEEEPEEGFIDE